jgi:hypothetical protein
MAIWEITPENASRSSTVASCLPYAAEWSILADETGATWEMSV